MSKAKEYRASVNEIKERGKNSRYSKNYYTSMLQAIDMSNHKTLEDVEEKENDLLNEFCKYLEDHGYIDTDWWQEGPYTIDEFKKSKEYKNWKSIIKSLKL